MLVRCTSRLTKKQRIYKTLLDREVKDIHQGLLGYKVLVTEAPPRRAL